MCMDIQQFTGRLIVKNTRKIVLVVMDGVGGLPGDDGKTALERANTPNMDRLTVKSALGLTIPVFYGITPGSGPSHLALFGYDPVKHNIGRGVLEALGIGLELTPRDVAVRANFATVDENGIVLDRRAGRIPTEKNKELVNKLAESIKEIDGIEVILRSGKEHRFVVVFRGDGLVDGLPDTDPQKEGKPIRVLEARTPDEEKTVWVVNEFSRKVREILKGEKPANACLLRGIAKHPHLPPMEKAFGVKPACIATYPMYRGLARLVGMDILPAGESLHDEVECLKQHWDAYDFFYVHIKKTDSYGEDGNQSAKVKVIEEFDSLLPLILDLNPDVLVITGDHSTPAKLASHSWHPNPFLLYSPFVLGGTGRRFTERECITGELGQFPAVFAINLMLAHSLKLKKYGA